MKQILFFLVTISAACNDHQQQSQNKTDTGAVKSRTDTTLIIEEIRSEEPPPPPPPPPPKIYANARFKDVVVEQTGAHQFLINGKAQVFEANISWVVEDGHEELKKGFQMTDAGAPAWGNFTFSLMCKKSNRTLL